MRRRLPEPSASNELPRFAGASSRCARSLKRTRKASLPCSSISRHQATASSSFSNPQLLDGAWAASASCLSELVADFKLIADLSVTYGRLEELRWRLRYRTEHHSALLDGMTAPHVTQPRGEVEDLLKRVGRQISGPTVQTIGVAVETNLAGSITPRVGRA